MTDVFIPLLNLTILGVGLIIHVSLSRVADSIDRLHRDIKK